MIEVHDIYKSYGNLEVLRGINLTIQQGEVVSIVGRSGAGKSTLLHIMGTLDKPDRGEILFNGQSVSSLKDHQLSHFRNRHIGFVFQFHQLLPEFSAIENVMMPALIANTDRKEAQQRAQELLDFLGLKDRMKHHPGELSGGEKQRVAVARALMNKPDVIFADEPSGSLDSQNKQDLHQLFFDLRREMGQTFVIVTHDEGLAEMSDRIIRMADGLIIE